MEANNIRSIMVTTPMIGSTTTTTTTLVVAMPQPTPHKLLPTNI
jgi:hypothetical protein